MNPEGQMTQSTETPNQSTTVQRVQEKNRYEIRIDGQPVGFAAYRDKGDQRVFYHTEIDEAFGGRGLSTVLVTQALTEAREAGKRIVPVCPFVAAYLKKHDGFADITDRVTPDILQWLDVTSA
jgi:predicted GNAT family acetyltransferase